MLHPSGIKPFTRQQFGIDFLSDRLCGRINYPVKKRKIKRKISLKEKKITTGGEGFEQALREACEGLLYLSESEAEIVPFFGVKVADCSRKTILGQFQLVKGSPIEERQTAEFFSRLTTIKDWFSKIEIRNARQFERLQKLLEDNLVDLTVLRIGRIQIDIYVAGIDRSGNLAGFKTKAVET